MTARTASARNSGVASAVPVDQASIASTRPSPVAGFGSPAQSSSSSHVRTTAEARFTSDRMPSTSVRADDMTAIRLPATNRRLTVRFDSATFWWISLLAKRVRAESSDVTRTSASVAPTRSARPSTSSASASASSAPTLGSARRASAAASSLSTARSPLADTDLDVPEAGSRDAVPDVADLARLALAAVRGTEHDPAGGVADGIARAPELVGDAGVGRVLEEPALHPSLDLVGDLGRELEVQAAIVDRPAAVARQVQPIVGVGDDVV